MRKIINIFTILILLCGSVIYCLRLESFESSQSETDSVYDASISQEIESLISDNNSLREIIKTNHTSNSDAILNNPDDTNIEIVKEVFDDFFEVHNRALENHNNAKNVEIIASTGKVYSTGTFNGMNVIITGSPYLKMQRNANGERYLNVKIMNMQIPYLPTGSNMDNTYYFSGSKYYINQLYMKKNYTQRNFIETYSYNISDFISDINENTVTVDSFSYDSFTERYTAKITFKTDGNGKILGLDDYHNFIQQASNNERTGPASIKITERNVTLIISKNCQFIAMASTEHLSGYLYWSEFNITVKQEVDLSLLWTFSYPKSISITPYTF